MKMGRREEAQKRITDGGKSKEGGEVPFLRPLFLRKGEIITREEKRGRSKREGEGRVFVRRGRFKRGGEVVAKESKGREHRHGGRGGEGENTMLWDSMDSSLA